jgi:hypothetical protein
VDRTDTRCGQILGDTPVQGWIRAGWIVLSVSAVVRLSWLGVVLSAVEQWSVAQRRERRQEGAPPWMICFALRARHTVSDARGEGKKVFPVLTAR